ncbi:unnamed protein product [Penicillium roqueforti FM164]|uniref:Genomic scaffold, ProqFM164S02 n=1 Tax=Penicillium roqueforti (strain FM164) TaxID=1365484 RepID=W6Q1X3_PENRF|nr:unnamed protein product [Penicillium roqueforti FM164]
MCRFSKYLTDILLRANKPRSIFEANNNLSNLTCRRLNNVSPKGPHILAVIDTIWVLLFNLELSGFSTIPPSKELDQHKINRCRSDLRRKIYRTGLETYVLHGGP